MKALNRKEALVNAKANGTLDDFKPLTREEAFIKKTLELGGGDVAWEDIKNPPFGEEVVENVLWERTGIVNMVSTDTESWSNNFSPNADVVVEINGEKYSANTGEYNAPDMFSYGYHFNVQINDTVRVYFDMCVVGATSSVNIVGDDTGAYDICIYTETSTITPLDPKYLPPLTSPNGTQYKLTVSDDGTLSATAV